MSSAIKTPAFQAKAGNIQNEDGSSIYSNGDWSLKNSTAVARVTITDAGSVGIGTASPAVAAHIQGTASTYLRVARTNFGYIQLGAVTAENTIYSRDSADAAKPLSFVLGTTERMRIDANGVVSIHQGTILGIAKGISFGLSTTDGRFKMATALLPSSGHNATIGYNTNTGIVSYVSSSRLVKSEITPISYGLDAVMSLQPRNYVNQVGEKKVGFIADEVEAVIPELVGIGEKKVFTNKEEDTEMIPVSVHYQDMTAVLCKAIQEQQAQIEEMKAKIAALEAK